MHKNLKDELIIKIDYSSLEAIDKLVKILKSNDLEVEKIGQDEYSIKL